MPEKPLPLKGAGVDWVRIIQCPHANNDWAPCLAREGAFALSEANTCVGCGMSPKELLIELDKKTMKKFSFSVLSKIERDYPNALANLFRDQVAKYVKEKESQ